MRIIKTDTAKKKKKFPKEKSCVTLSKEEKVKKKTSEQPSAKVEEVKIETGNVPKEYESLYVNPERIVSSENYHDDTFVEPEFRIFRNVSFKEAVALCEKALEEKNPMSIGAYSFSTSVAV